MGKKLTFRIFLILSIPVFIYFWGVAIVGNIANFWNFFTPADFKEIVWEDSPVTPPSFSGLPKAVKESKFSVRGFAQEGVEVFIYLNGIEAARVRADKNGSFSYEGLKLGEGDNDLFAKAVNGDKIESQPSARSTVKYLIKAPFLEIINLGGERNEIHQKTGAFNLVGKTTPGSLVTVNASQVFSDSNGNFSYLYSLSDGENKITFEASDEAGNKSVIEKIVVFFKE